MTTYQKSFIIFFAVLILTGAGIYQHNKSKLLLIEKQKNFLSQKEKEEKIKSEINNVLNPEISVSSSIKSSGEHTFIMFTNLPDETQIEGDILHIKNNSADEVIDTFKGVIKNERFVLEGTIDPTIFKEDNIAKLKFVGDIKYQDLSKTFATEVYDYTKYFLPPEPVEEVAEENEYNEKYEAIQNEPVKTFNIPSAYLLAEALSSTFGYYVENSNIDGLKITTLSGNNSAIMITGFDVSRVYVSGTFPVNSLDYGTIMDIIFADVDVDMWVMAQIDNSKNGRYPLKESYIKDDLNIEFQSDRVGFSITATPQ